MIKCSRAYELGLCSLSLVWRLSLSQRPICTNVVLCTEAVLILEGHPYLQLTLSFCAVLVFALANLYDVKGDISALARLVLVSFNNCQ